MFVKTFLVGCLIAAVSANQEEFDNFKIKFSKVYTTAAEHQHRYEIFERNLQEIQEHNAKYDQGLVSWYKAVNQFSDLTSEEFQSRHLNLDMPIYNKSEHRTIRKSAVAIPDEIDWRTYGYVTEVKDQGSCGCCWAFSATGSLEGLYAKSYGQLLSFSEQELVDCAIESSGYDCHGCTNGIVQEGLRYVANNGMVTEQTYPYDMVQGTCRQDGDIFDIYDYVDIPHNDEDSLKYAVGTVGPVSIALNFDILQNYGGGIFDDDDCPTKVNHAILIVGYGKQDGLDYWIVKNQWGITWGDKGYGKIAIGKNLCGLASQACYPIL